jgi:CubicO group peptidase (beta-lactamase class C family)
MFWLGLLVFAGEAVAQCPPLGSTLPLATDLAKSPIVKKTLEGIDALLTKDTAAFNSTGFAIALGTTRDESPLLEFSNSPTVYNVSGTHNLTTDTQFIVASVSKLFTAYGIKLLADKVDTNDPLTKFVPELLHLKGQPVPPNGIASTDWSAITIEALLSHLSGIAEDLGDSDIDNAPGNYSALGLPILTGSDQGTKCGAAENPYQRPCTETDFLDNWGKKYPVYAPFTTPSYSNIGYALLALVIERATGKTYGQFMAQKVFRPLGMQHTSVDHPLELSDAFITALTADGDLSEGFLAGSVGGKFYQRFDTHANDDT